MTVTTGWNLPGSQPRQEDDKEAWEKRFRKAMSLAKHEGIALDDFERHELALMVPGVDRDGEGSWRDLTIKQLDSLITMLEGYAYIRFLIEQR